MLHAKNKSAAAMDDVGLNKYSTYTVLIIIAYAHTGVAIWNRV